MTRPISVFDCPSCRRKKKPAASTGFRQPLNGSTPVALGQIQRHSFLATLKPSWLTTLGIGITQASKPSLLEQNSRTLGDSSIHTATCGRCALRTNAEAALGMFRRQIAVSQTNTFPSGPIGMATARPFVRISASVSEWQCP